MPITFTKHARERMAERKVSVAEVFRVLAFGYPNPTRANSVWAADANRIPDMEWRRILAPLRVVCTDDLQVITVYREEHK